MVLPFGLLPNKQVFINSQNHKLNLLRNSRFFLRFKAIQQTSWESKGTPPHATPSRK